MNSPRDGAQPFVKWVGGKRSLMSVIENLLPEKFNTYFEPFVGGGAVYFALAPESAVLVDRNTELVVAYQAIKKTPGALLERLRMHAEKHSESYFYHVRQQTPIAPIEIAARFLYLNKTCFNGLYRVNKSGGFNAPFGRYRNPNIIQAGKIRACHRTLQQASISFGDFEKIEPQVKVGDFVYLDPPYHPTDDLSFTKYTKENFTEVDQVRLRDFALRLHKRGAYVMLSNSETKFIRDLYKASAFQFHTVMAPRTVNCKPLERHRVKELLITNYRTHGRGKKRGSRSRQEDYSKDKPWSPGELHGELSGEVHL